MNKPVRIALVGAGSMAEQHARAFRDIPDAEIVGICSRTPDRAQRLATAYGIPHVCGSVAELHERTKAELVVVAVSEPSILSVVSACMELPWQLLIEKPPGWDVPDAEKLLARSVELGERVYVALNRRFYSVTQAALRDLSTDEGYRHIRVTDQQSLAQAAGIGHPEETLKRWMYVCSIHVIDYLRVFARSPVTKVEPVLPWDSAHPKVVCAKIAYQNGDTGIYEGIWHGPGPWGVSVTTSRQRWEFCPLEEATVQVAGERKRTPIAVHEYDKRFKPGFRLQAEEAVRAVRAQSNQSVTLSDAVESMRLIARIFGHSH